jgi:hypothetical protein
MTQTGNPECPSADALLERWLHPSHDRRVESDAGHQSKMAPDVVRFVDRQPQMNAPRLTSGRDHRRFFFVQRQTKFTRKHVSRTARNDREATFGPG